MYRSHNQVPQAAYGIPRVLDERLPAYGSHQLIEGWIFLLHRQFFNLKFWENSVRTCNTHYCHEQNCRLIFTDLKSTDKKYLFVLVWIPFQNLSERSDVSF